MIKTQDEISLLNHSAAMVDAAYHDLYRAMKPGMRENEAVGLVAKRLYDLGSEYVEGVNAISGERCSPHPHVFSDRMLRPGDPVYYDILHSYMGYRTCYYRTFAIGSASRALNDAYKRCRDYLDAAIELVRPGRTTAEIASVWPKAQEFGFPDEEAAFALQMGHGIGLAIWEKPMISRLVSLEHSYEIKPGMVFALETFWPSKDGWSAARIEEEVVVTPTGHEIITRFPAEKLLVCGAPYVTVDGPLETTRELEAGTQSGRRQYDRVGREVRGWRPVVSWRFRLAGRQRAGWNRYPRFVPCRAEASRAIGTSAEKAASRRTPAGADRSRSSRARCLICSSASTASCSIL